MSIREAERASIVAFLDRYSGRFAGMRVLDYGSGARPYQELIEAAGGFYTPFDDEAFPGHVSGYESNSWPHIWLADPFDVVVCTQVVQYVVDVREFFSRLRGRTRKRNGLLLMTGPTNWPLVETVTDLRRYTTSGIFQELDMAGFHSIEVGYRHEVEFEGETWPLGWWAVAS